MKMNSIVLSDKQRVSLNHDVSMAEIDSAIKTLKAHKILVEPKALTYYLVNEEYLSPRTFVDRVERGFYGRKKEESDEGRETTEVDVQSHTGRSVRTVGRRKVDSDTDERNDERRGTSGDGRGAGTSSRKTGPRSKTVARKKAKTVRKSSSGVSEHKDDNRTNKAPLERKVRSKVNRKKPSRTGRRRRT